MSKSMYPRPDAALVPPVLNAPFGAQAVAADTLERLGLPAQLCYAQLDAPFTANLDVQAREILGSAVIEQVERRMGEISGMTTPIYFPVSPAEDPALSTRARNALGRHRFTHGVLPRTIAQLASIPEFGAKSLLEVLAQAEFPVQPAAGGRASPAVMRAARELCAASWSASATCDDPRLSELVRGFDEGTGSLREAGQRASERLYDPTQARRVAGAIRALTERARRLARMAVDRELTEIVEALVTHESARTAVIARLGLGGHPAMTLNEVGEELGVSRERVRQIETRFRKQIEERERVWTPALQRALRLAVKLSPTTASEFQHALVERRLIAADFSVGSVLRAAKLFGQEIEYDTHSEIIGALPAAAGRVVAEARRLVTHWGATTLAEVCAELDPDEQEPALAKVAALILEAQEQFEWLDRDRGWFWLRDTSRNRLFNQIEKIMAVAGSLTIGDLRDGVGRHHRMKGFRPPREVLARLCEASGLYVRRGELILGKPGLADWRDVLGHNESTLVEILLDHGPVMTREELERLAVDEAGLKRSSFYAYLSYSPVLARFAPGVYGLRGATVSAAQVDAMIPHMARTQVLQDHGWTPAGAIWIGYRISAAGERSGVLGVPGAIKRLVRGSYALSTQDGRGAGRLTLEENMWGLSSFYRRYGIEEGDYLVIVLELQSRTATVYAGSQELLLRFQSGE